MTIRLRPAAGRKKLALADSAYSWSARFSTASPIRWVMPPARNTRAPPRIAWTVNAGRVAPGAARRRESRDVAAIRVSVLREGTLESEHAVEGVVVDAQGRVLAATGRPAEAREWAQRVIAKKPTMPAYMRRRERPWFRKAAALIKKLPN